MNNISIFLKKYIDLGIKDKLIINTFIETIDEICGVSVDSDKVEIKDRNININIQGPEKTEIYINKEKIKEEFYNKLDNLGYKYSDRSII